MLKKISIFLFLSALLLTTIHPASAVNVSGKVCNAQTKVCVSNITNGAGIVDQDLLDACKNCCSVSTAFSPVKGCPGRCQQSCEKLIKKLLKK